MQSNKINSNNLAIRVAKIAGFALIFILIQLVLTYFIVINQRLGILIITYLTLIFIAAFLFKLSASDSPVWVRALFVVVLADFILGYGFSNFAIGVGIVRVTVGELVLMLSLFWIIIKSWQSLWITGLPAFVLLVYVLLPVLFHLPFDLPKFGLVAARDFLPLLDSLFFFAGVCVVAVAGSAAQWKAWRHRFLWLLLLSAFVYLPFYPFQQYLLAHSPRVTGYQQAVPLIGYFTTANVLAVAGILAVVLIPNQFSWRSEKSAPKWMLVVAFSVFAIAAVAIQSRAAYIVLVLSFVFLAVNGHGQAVGRFIFAAMVMVMALLLVDLSGFEFKGRLGKVGVEMIVDQLASVTGQGGHEGGRGGVDQRKIWWESSLAKWISGPDTVLIGTGFGQALTNFSVAGAGGSVVVVREPHNSYISVLVRTGIVGFLPWLFFHVLLISRVWVRFRNDTQKKQSSEAGYWLWVLLLFISMLVVAVVEPVFESPYFSVPYFFFAGLCLGEISRESSGWVKISGKFNKQDFNEKIFPY